MRAISTVGAFGFGEQTIVAEVDLKRRDSSSGYTAGNGVRRDMVYAADGQVESIRITSDPLGLIAGYNTYGYAGGNPLSVIDPQGLIITIMSKVQTEDHCVQ